MRGSTSSLKLAYVLIFGSCTTWFTILLMVEKELKL